MIEGTVHIDGKAYDLDELTLGDLEWLEDELGLPIEEIDMGSMKAMIRLVYLLKRREDESFTLDQARGLKLSIFNEPDPEPAPEPVAGAVKPRPTKRKAT